MGSLQRIEDSYIQRDYKGDQLRKALETDRQYQKILAERKSRLTKKFEVTPGEESKYVLSEDEDFKILGKAKQLEKQKINKIDQELISLIRTQLEHDWRKPLLKTLDKLLKKYQAK